MITETQEDGSTVYHLSIKDAPPSRYEFVATQVATRYYNLVNPQIYREVRDNLTNAMRLFGSGSVVGTVKVSWERHQLPGDLVLTIKVEKP